MAKNIAECDVPRFVAKLTHHNSIRPRFAENWTKSTRQGSKQESSGWTILWLWWAGLEEVHLCGHIVSANAKPAPNIVMFRMKPPTLKV